MRTFRDPEDDIEALKEIRTIAEQVTEVQPFLQGADSWTSTYITRDGHKNKLLVYQRSSANKDTNLPVIVHLHHGGGFSGSPEASRPYGQSLAIAHNCIVFVPQYRLAPEHKYPQGLNDCVDAVKHIVVNASSFGADVESAFILSGIDFGASTAAIISLHAQELGIPTQITGLFLSCGRYISNKVPVGYEDQYRSRNQQRCMTSLLDGEGQKMADRLYGGDLDAPLYCACNVASMDLYKGQPRVCFQVYGMDILRDDGLIFEEILRKNGAETRIDIYAGMPHLYWTIADFKEDPLYTKWQDDTTDGFMWLLGREKTVDS